MIHFVVPAAGAFGIDNYLAQRGAALAGRVRVVHYDALPALERLERGTWILSGLDQLGPAATRLTGALHDALHDAEGVRVLNDPARTLRRHDLLAALHADGRNDFRAVRAGGDLEGLRYPVFLRHEHAHDGPVSPLLRSRAEVEAAVGRALVQGSRLRDLLVVEFCDTADDAGYYRKYAAFVVGERVIARSLAYGRGWMLKHQATEFTPAMVEEERRYLFENPHADVLRAIFARAHVGYGRIDYALRDGRVQTWEINLNPTIGRGLRPGSGKVPPALEAIREEGKRRFYAELRAALEAVDAGGESLAPIPFPADAALREAARAELAHAARPTGGVLADAVRRALRPARPLLEPIAARVLPFVGRLSALGSRRSAL